jgi:hypothetical protein
MVPDLHTIAVAAGSLENFLRLNLRDLVLLALMGGCLKLGLEDQCPLSSVGSHPSPIGEDCFGLHASVVALQCRSGFGSFDRHVSFVLEAFSPLNSQRF